MKGQYFDDYLKEQLKDPEFKKEWDKGDVAYQITREIIKARIASKASQRELAKTARTTQAVISRLENMTVSPTVKMLQRIAAAFGKKLQIKFV